MNDEWDDMNRAALKRARRLAKEGGYGDLGTALHIPGDWQPLRQRAEALRGELRSENPYYPGIPCAGPVCERMAAEGHYFCSPQCRNAYVALEEFLISAPAPAPAARSDGAQSPPNGPPAPSHQHPADPADPAESPSD